MYLKFSFPIIVCITNIKNLNTGDKDKFES